MSDLPRFGEAPSLGFPGSVGPDRSAPEEKLATVRTIRDQIRAKIEAWCDEICVAAKTPST